MKRLLAIFLLTFLTLSAAAQTVSFNGVRQDIVIDVRTAFEYQAGHIPGAINVPLDEIETGIYQVGGINKNSRVLVYCRSGRRSAIARNALLRQGFKQVYDGGGIETLAPKLKLCSAQRC